MEDISEITPPLTATKAKYLEAINDLSRVVLPSFVEQDYTIRGCKTSEIEALATELEREVNWFNGSCYLEIENDSFTLTIQGGAFHG